MRRPSNFSSQKSNESEPLALQESESVLDKMVAKIIKDPRKLSIFYGICNMSNFLIGAGILALTAVFSTGGWLIGSILFIIFAIATWFSLDLLLDAASSTNAFSYEGVAFSVGGWALQMVCVIFAAFWSSLLLHSKLHAQLIIVPQFVKVIIIIDSYGFLAAYMNVTGELHSSILSNNLSRIRFNAALLILFQA